MLKSYLLLALATGLTVSAAAQDTVRIMTYNILRYDGTDDADRHDEYQTVLEYVKPDLIAVQEMEDAGPQEFLDEVLDYDTNFARSGYTNDNDAISQMFYYRKDKFELLSYSDISTDLRPIIVGKFIHLRSGDTLTLYNVHLKASQGSTEETQRRNEVAKAISDANKLHDSAYFMILGDFNIYDDDEAAYTSMVDNGPFNDPLIDDFVGSYRNNSDNSEYYTQSPRTTQFGGGANGGMDDRFDMILFSDAVNAGTYVEYIDGTMVAVGNDGNKFNGAINAGTNTAVPSDVADALHDGSDHLPVYADFIFKNDITSLPEKGRMIGTISTFPNPTDGRLSVTYQTAQPVAVTMTLRTADGRTLSTHTFAAASGKQTVEYPLNDNLTDGLYYLSTQARNQSKVNKVIILR